MYASARRDPLAALSLALLAGAILSAPFPYGAVQLPHAARLIALSLLSGLALLLSRDPLVLRDIRWPATSLGALACLGLLQLAPLPHRLLAALSPASLDLHQEAAAVARAWEVTPATACLSIAPVETRFTVLLVAAYLSALLVATALSRTREVRRALLGVVLVSGLVQLVSAIAAAAPRLARLNGSFFNPNHFAGYLEISLGLASGLVVWASVSRTPRTLERRLALVTLATLLWGAIAAGIGLSRSRGALVAVLLSLPVVIFLGRKVRRRRSTSQVGRRDLVVTLTPLVLGVLFAFAVTGSVPLRRLLATDTSDLGAEGRVVLWRASIEAFRSYPLLGSGLGTFREAFRPAQPRGLVGLVEQAHSEPLQLLVTGGALGALVGLAGAFLALLFLARNVGVPPRSEDRATVLAGVAALLSLLVHGLFEFSFSLPAIPLTLLSVVGAATAAARDEATPRFPGDVEGEAPPPDPARLEGVPRAGEA